jgi:tetratricopeptide (TPR) repeat protein
MKTSCTALFALALVTATWADAPAAEPAKVRAWTGTLTLPTYPWEDDVNPKFWALEGSNRLSTTVKGSITYPYTMQDHLLRNKVDRTYKAVFLENEYLKITCLPELGGRLHSVFDKTTGREMFHTSKVIKPGMIAMRGAWISGGVEWNTGPHGHTVTIVSPVDVFSGENPDGSAFLEINNIEKIFRTRWTVRVTLRPGKAYLDEAIRISNPTDGTHPYYFWNCTAFPNRPGTRFIYPMTLGTDHSAREFFRWPIHEGRDLTWLKNYPQYTSVFAWQCEHDFFGAYDVEADRGIVSVADHRALPGKKAWTWGQWEFGKVAQRNLADGDDPYIEVQSGPLPTQSDYGLLEPHQQVSWQEYWYPVHGLGDGFEYANRDVAFRTARKGNDLEVRVLATSAIPRAKFAAVREGKELMGREFDLSPRAAATFVVPGVGQSPAEIVVKDAKGQNLARFTTPLPIAKVDPPDPATFKEKPEGEMTVEELYYKGRRHDRDTSRLAAREWYDKALAKDPGHVASLRALAILDFEAGLYADAVRRSKKALDRDPDDGLAWYYLGVSQLQLGKLKEARDCGIQASKLFGTASIGYDLAGRAAMRQKDYESAVGLFTQATQADGRDERAREHLMIALMAAGKREEAHAMAARAIQESPTSLVPRTVVMQIVDNETHAKLVNQGTPWLGERGFECLEASLVFADLGCWDDATKAVHMYFRVEGKVTLTALPFYYYRYFRSEDLYATKLLEIFEKTPEPDATRTFASRPEEVEILKFAIEKNPKDASAHLHLGNLLANLGRLDEAARHWELSAGLDSKKATALRNLGLLAWAKGDFSKAESLYRRAVAARPDDQTLHRDLAECLLAAGKRPEAIEVMEKMPVKGLRRAEITIALAQAYLDEKRYGDTVKLLESTPYFVNWEGQDVTWRIFNRAHIERGRQLLEKEDFAAALKDFEAALTYPANLNVGRSDKPEEAAAQYWRGKALAALGRADDARSAWKEGAAGAAGSAAQNEHRDLCRKALEGK